MGVAEQHAAEVASGKRFEFGSNWQLFLKQLNEERIATAQRSLEQMLGVADLKGRSFLDIGSGSGLFSLAARRLGARVHSFDYDPQSVACTREVRRRYSQDDPEWVVEAGSALDAGYVKQLGQFDVVYSWGVLHHTGSMWQALEHAAWPVKPGGKLFIAIYNDQGTPSRRWVAVKKRYNRAGALTRKLILGACFAHLYWRPLLKDVLRGDPKRTFREYSGLRGMSVWRDLVDWVGGYPMEVARPEEIFDFYRARGFTLERMTTNGGSMGCNEFVFRR